IPDPGVELEGPLHLRRGDVLPAPDDQLLDTARDDQPPFVVHHPEVATAEPTPVHRRCGLLRIGVAGEELRAPDPHLALVPRPAPPPRGRVGDAYDRVAHRLAVGVATTLRGIGIDTGRYRRCLGGPVAALDDGPETGLGRLDELGRHP